MSSTFNQSAIARIGWLIDPDSSFDEALMERTLAVLRDVVNPRGCTIEPIRTHEPSVVRSALRRLLHKGERSYEFPKRYGHFEILPMRVFDWGRVSSQSLSYYLSCYGQLNHIDLFIVPDRARFLDLLSVESKIPLLLISANNKQPRQIRQILYPILDPKKCIAGFGNLLEFGKVLGARVILLHQRPSEFHRKSWTPGNEEFDAIPFFEPEVLAAELTTLTIISSWVKIARDKGVEIELKFSPGAIGFDRSVLGFQKSFGCDLIALDPSFFESGHKSEFLKVVRESKCPVWISRPIGQSAVREAIQTLEDRLLGRVG